MRNKERKKAAFPDFVLIGILICFSVFIIIDRVRPDDGGLSVVVKKNSEVVFSRSLSDISEAEEICVDDEFNVIICVERSGVSVSHSDCSDKVCINTGKITMPGQSIVCLPAHVSIELRGDDSEADAVVG